MTLNRPGGSFTPIMSLYYINVTIHVLAAFLWLGGLLFLGFVGAPALRKVEPPALRADIFKRIGLQFRPVGWTAIVVLLATGGINLHFRGLLTWAVLGNGDFWVSAYGTALMWKILAVTGIVLGSAVHDFVLGPAASRAEPDSPEAVVNRRRASWVARINAVFALILLMAAVRLTRGV